MIIRETLDGAWFIGDQEDTDSVGNDESRYPDFTTVGCRRMPAVWNELKEKGDEIIEVKEESFDTIVPVPLCCKLT